MNGPNLTIFRWFFGVMIFMMIFCWNHTRVVPRMLSIYIYKYIYIYQFCLGGIIYVEFSMVPFLYDSCIYLMMMMMMTMTMTMTMMLMMMTMTMTMTITMMMMMMMMIFEALISFNLNIVFKNMVSKWLVVSPSRHLAWVCPPPQGQTLRAREGYSNGTSIPIFQGGKYIDSKCGFCYVRNYQSAFPTSHPFPDSLNPMNWHVVDAWGQQPFVTMGSEEGSWLSIGWGTNWARFRGNVGRKFLGESKGMW